MELQNRLLLKSYAVKRVSISEGEMGSGNVWGIGSLRGRSHEDVVRENRGYCVLLKWKVSSLQLSSIQLVQFESEYLGTTQ